MEKLRPDVLKLARLFQRLAFADGTPHPIEMEEYPHSFDPAPLYVKQALAYWAYPSLAAEFTNATYEVTYGWQLSKESQPTQTKNSGTPYQDLSPNALESDSTFGPSSGDSMPTTSKEDESYCANPRPKIRKDETF